MSGTDANELRRRMTGAIDTLKKEFGGLRTGRASANLLDPVRVDAYGQSLPMSQVGTVNAPEPRMITVQVWDKSMIKAVEKAIVDSNLGLSPSTEGQVIRLRIPELNEERRKELVKVAHKYAEAARVAVRHVRRDALEQPVEGNARRSGAVDGPHGPHATGARRPSPGGGRSALDGRMRGLELPSRERA